MVSKRFNSFECPSFGLCHSSPVALCYCSLWAAGQKHFRILNVPPSAFYGKAHNRQREKERERKREAAAAAAAAKLADRRPKRWEPACSERTPKYICICMYIVQCLCFRSVNMHMTFVFRR